MSALAERPVTAAPQDTASVAATNLVRCPTFDRDSDGDGVPDGWYASAPRPALRPRFGLDEQGRRSGRWAATAAGAGNTLCFGKWGQIVPLAGGRHYRVSAVFRHQGLESVGVNVLIALVWQVPGKTNRDCPTDHLDRFRLLPDGWTLAEGVVAAPRGCTALDLELYFRFAPQGTVWWDSVRVEEVAAPAARTVTLATARWRPDDPSTPERNLEELSDVLDKAGHLGADLVCLPEMLNKAGMRHVPYEEIAEDLRGPTFQLLSRKSRQYRMYTLGCIYERDGDFIFNTAFLVDRAGELAGTYRKVHLYWPEEREGVSPGDDLPVFDLDFGRVGVMICYDSWFPETAKLLAQKGAEIILFPNAGYGEEQVMARSGDNAVYVVASTLNSPAYIADPSCRVLARTSTLGLVTATVDLNERGTAHPNAGGTLNASPGGRTASRHAPSLRLYRELLAAAANHPAD
jgi:predicted amidohydrolase